jgi:threonine/homoserine/homoserine lactone efflux protein
MSPAETALAIFVLLVTPGPTNTLLAIAGTERGWSHALRLIPAEIGGYLVTTIPLALVGVRLLEALPASKTAITLAAAAWVLWLSIALWRVPATRTGDLTVTARRVALTTFLNPKALIFGLVLLPATDSERVLFNFGLFVSEVVIVAAMWATIGAFLRHFGRVKAGVPPGWRRATSVWLGALAVYLLGRVVGLA